MKPRPFRLPDRRVWLRVADPAWDDPLDPTWAGRLGRRWNPPGSFPTLYLIGDPPTARLQLRRMLEGQPVNVEDLTDDAFVLVAARLPRDQDVADGLTEAGLRALELPEHYPRDEDGRLVSHDVCQPIGEAVHARGLRGVLCRSAAAPDGTGAELAWFPTTTRSAARPVWDRPLDLGDWRDATTWEDLRLPEQPALR